MRRIVFAALCAALFVGCGGAARKPPSSATLPQPTAIPKPAAIPESATRPDGYTPATPPVSVGPTAGPVKHIDGTGLLLIERFEGFSSCPYYDTVGTGHPWTRGFGETEGITRYSPCITVAQGTANLKRLIETRYEWGIRGIGVTFNQNQWDALCSFAYNLGAGIFTGSLRASLRAHNPSPMLAYDHAGGVVLEGLRTRRILEVALFNKPVAHPASRKDLLTRQRVLRRVLLRYGCRARKATGQKLGPKCVRWFREGARIGHELQ